MSDILGYDCDGKPLRAGDRVIRIHDGHLSGARSGDMNTILGACPVAHSCVEIDLPHPGLIWEWWFVPANELRKHDQPETGDWSEIERETGWRPRIEAEA